MSTATKTPDPTPTVVRQPTILRVRADQASFKEVTFQPGFNVVLAERTQDSTRKESRNGLGKSSLIEVISFCLGASAGKKDPMRAEALANWTFTLDMNLGGQIVAVSRETSNHGEVYIEGDTSNWPIQPTQERGGTRRKLKVADWNAYLGSLMFGIPHKGFNTDYAPTYRSLIGYFIRRGKDAFSTAFEHYRKQLEWDKQVNNAFLLGFAWEDASAWQKLKDEKKVLEDLKHAGKSPILVDLLQGSSGELEAAKVRLENVVKESAGALNTFDVHPQFRDLEAQANTLTVLITKAANRVVSCRQLLDSYEASLAEIPDTNIGDVTEVYREAGVLFPVQTRKTLDEVKAFHRQLIDNRTRFLATEIERLHADIAEAGSAQRNAIDERAEVLRTLKGKGALEEYQRLQAIHAENLAQLKAVEQRISVIRRMEEGRSNLKIQEERLKQKTRNDLDDRKDQRLAIKLFNANSEALYESPGNLVVEVGSTGFRFDVEIIRSGSQGIENMKILCYDLMLTELWSNRTPSPHMLIHDSLLFDGVDERQIAMGLELAERKALECGFQYICTLNSDTIPWKDFSDGFDLRRFVRLTLTDRSAEGSLFGIRY